LLFVLVFFGLQAPAHFLPKRYDTYQIPAGSMAPTIIPGDHIVVDLTAYAEQTPQEGELALDRSPRDERIIYLKRVIAGPGDEVRIQDHQLYVNGKKVPSLFEPQDRPLTEGESKYLEGGILSYAREELVGRSYGILVNQQTLLNREFGPAIVPTDHYFVMGDNRDRSSDSRIWGSVPRENFLGRPAFLYYSKVPGEWRWHWDRIGQRLE
jgi:signal peptidase I